jgi:hypothetical protein
MVARGFLGTVPFLTRAQDCGVGIVPSVAVAAIVPPLLGLRTWASFTLAVAAVGSGALIGSTIGPHIADHPRPVAASFVAAISVTAGTVVAMVPYPLGVDYVAPLKEYVVGWLITAFFGYFLFALPGVVLGIIMAERSAPGLGYRARGRTNG